MMKQIERTTKHRSAIYAGDEPNPRPDHRYEINQHSAPRKVMRWLKRFGICAATTPETLAKHVHPRHKRAAA